MKKNISLVLCILIILSTFVGCKKPSFKIYDAKNKVFETIESNEDIKNLKFKSYSSIVIDEAKEIMSSKLNCTKEEVVDALCKGEYSIYTYFDESAYDAAKKAYKEINVDLNFGCTLTDLHSNIIAAFSGNKDKKSANYATELNAPYSSFKPLSVYSQAIEKGIVNWSSVIEDSPYRQVKNADGTMRDWPSNADGKYLYKDVTMNYAIKKSLNTVAVKLINEVGINNSIDFLQESLGIDLSQEKARSLFYGEEDELDNMSMGYLIKGVSTVDMAGYYEIFGNLGKYTKPKTISKICDSSGTTIYTREYVYNQVISPETASIMNLLMQDVISINATGEKAHIEDIKVSGKTGSGGAGEGNWFVGITPSYSCAVWYSYYDDDTKAAESFSNIISKLEKGEEDFNLSDKLIKKVYCGESGEILSADCKKAEIGYYTEDNMPEVCNKH